MLKCNIKQITQIGRCPIRTNCLNGLTAKALVKPAVIIVFGYGWPCDHAVIIKGFQRTHTLIFLIRKYRFQPLQRLMILKKRIKNDHCKYTCQQQNNACCKKLFQKFLSHKFFRFLSLKIKINKGTYLWKRNHRPYKNNCHEKRKLWIQRMIFCNPHRIFAGKNQCADQKKNDKQGQKSILQQIWPG